MPVDYLSKSMHCLNIVFACSSIAENQSKKAEFMKTHSAEDCLALGVRVEYNKDKKSFTKEEDFMIGDLEEELGPKWTKIAELIGGGRSGKDS